MSFGDDLETIGSAPLYCDRSTYSDAKAVLFRYGLWDKLPESVRTVISRGAAGLIPDTPKTTSPRIAHHLVGNNHALLMRAKQEAERLGFSAHIMTSRLRGEASEVAKTIVSIGEEIAATQQPFASPVCLLFGGETTVMVRGKGRGGRNQQMCLGALKEIGSRKDMLFFSAGSDGIDGNSDAAGALVDGTSNDRAGQLGLSIEDYLNGNDSYSFFKQTGDLVVTGPTGTNVMDLTMLLIGKEDH